jgi:hypothetical protein
MFVVCAVFFSDVLAKISPLFSLFSLCGLSSDCVRMIDDEVCVDDE